jgi:hypothetical protein
VLFAIAFARMQYLSHRVKKENFAELQKKSPD